MKWLLQTLFWILTITVVCSGQVPTYFPQIANGQQGGGISWVTWLFITNPGAAGTMTSGSIQFTQSNGTPFNITFIDVDTLQVAGSGNIITFQLNAGQTKVYLSNGTGPLTVGFATLAAGSRLSATAIFSEYGFGGGPGTPGGVNFGLLAEAGVPTTTPLTRQATFFYAANNFDTGVAIANIGITPADVTFQLLDVNGVALATPVTMTLAANNQTARFVNQLFPNAAVGRDGTMQIISTAPLAMVALRFSPSGVFTTLPVISLASLFDAPLEWWDERFRLTQLMQNRQYGIG